VFRSQELICPTIFQKNSHYPREIDAIPGSAGKTGKFARIGGTAAAPPSRQQSRLSVSLNAG